MSFCRQLRRRVHNEKWNVVVAVLLCAEELMRKGLLAGRVVRQLKGCWDRIPSLNPLDCPWDFVGSNALLDQSTRPLCPHRVGIPACRETFSEKLKCQN